LISVFTAILQRSEDGVISCFMVRSQLFYSLPDIGEGRAVARESQRYVQAIEPAETLQVVLQGVTRGGHELDHGRDDVP